MLSSLGVEINNREIVFDVFDSYLTVSPERQFFNIIHKKYYDIARRTYEKAFDDYQKLDGLDALCKNGGSWGANYIKAAINIAVQDLVSAGVQDMDINIFLNKYYSKYDCWDSQFLIVFDKYLEIVLEGEQLNQYRHERKENRGRFIGGGFGLSGAISGAAQAGALNIATGILHSGFNMIGNAFTAMSNASAKKKIFQDENTCRLILDGIYKSIINIKLAVIDVLYDYRLHNGKGCVFKEDEDKADRLFSNLKRGVIDKSNFNQVIIEILQLNPYCEQVYEYAIEIKGDDNGNINNIANYFNVNLEVFKNKIAAKFFTKLNFHDEKDFFINLESLNVFCQKIHLDKFRPLDELNYIKKKYESFCDNRQKFYDGFVYNSIDDKSNAIYQESIICAELKGIIKLSFDDYNDETDYKSPLLLSRLLNSRECFEAVNIATTILTVKQQSDYIPLSQIMKEKKIVDGKETVDQIIQNMTSSLTSYDNKISTTIKIKEALRKKRVDYSADELRAMLLNKMTIIDGFEFATNQSKKIKEIIYDEIKELDVLSRTFEGKVYSTLQQRIDAETSHRRLKEQKEQSLQAEKVVISSISDSINSSTASREDVAMILDKLNKLEPSISQAQVFLSEKIGEWKTKRNQYIQLDIDNDHAIVLQHSLQDEKVTIKKAKQSLEGLLSANMVTLSGGKRRDKEVEKCKALILKLEKKRKNDAVNYLVLFVCLIIAVVYFSM